MGGGGGGDTRSIGDIMKLVAQAKKELSASQQAGRKNVFISFAHEDLNTVNLLRGQAKSENSPLEFNDWSVSEPYDSERASYIRQKISERIGQSSVTVVFLSDNTPSSAWVGWEIEESVRQGKRVVGVYPQNAPPSTTPPAIHEHGIKCVAWPDLAREIASGE